jgi:CRP-like cAMP-binding protein
MFFMLLILCRLLDDVLSGAFHIYVATETEPTKRLVGQYEGSGSFGELALMYNMPRAATVQVRQKNDDIIN